MPEESVDTSCRLEALRRRLPVMKVDAVVISNLTNVRYLTGFTGTAGLALVAPAEACFFTDFRYEAQAAEQVRPLRVSIEKRSLLRAAALQAKKRRFSVVGVETHCLTVDQKESLEKAAPEVKWVSVKQAIEKARETKDGSEIETLRTAIGITDKAFESVVARLRPGLTESEVAWKLEESLIRLGAEGKSFETIVASGARSALPHGVASTKKLQLGDLITIDFGGKYQGYCADLTRTVCLGKSTSEQRKIYSIVRSAQLRAEEHLSSGLAGKAIDKIARDYITEKGYGKEFGHGLGHGVGLNIHEGPRLSSTATGKLCAGCVVTVEPGIYLKDWGGVRIEDVAWVSDNGCEILTTALKPARLPEI